MRYLIDTDWVIDYLEGRAEALELLRPLLPSGIAISAITYMEILEGVTGGRDPRDAEQAFQAFLHAASVVDIDRAVATRAAAIRVDLRRRGRPINPRALDLLIAATAVEPDLVLVSGNARHDGDVADLQRHRPA